MQWHCWVQLFRMRLCVTVLGVLVLLSGSLALEDSCLGGAHHKNAPGPERNMRECFTYSNSSCCHANFTEKLVSPVTKVDNTSWITCGNLSDRCEAFMKKIECFYQCSPHAAHWVNKDYPAGFLNVPVCVSFCDGWLEACKDDLTCAKNWLTDFKLDIDGNHCQHDCVPFSKMYSNGTDLCNSMWGPSFTASSSNCACLQMDAQDSVAVPHMLHSDSKSSSSAASQEKACQHVWLSKEKFTGKQEQ
ncbi:riboflavin-binding protein-like isoform X2 [Paramormyrops kingsleyae]|uniref:Riboflavin-binding protein-like n=1 Tax=Paramormyrops kingsleyae TaxID=1676925 RepID=A0A3B3SHV7_9TELE|nr:riboflavin-binding protein-like isoform X1 [Paramormyrops kingsleyae]